MNDSETKDGESRSKAIQQVLRASLVKQARRAADLRDLEIINKNAPQLNDEAEDVLRFQFGRTTSSG